MKRAADVRGSALIAGEVTMLRSQADVKFDTGDKEESGCLSADLARGPPWVLVPTAANAEGPDCRRGLQNRPGAHGAGEEEGGVGAVLPIGQGMQQLVMGQWWRVLLGSGKHPRLYFQ